MRFTERGLSARTAAVLIKAGIDAPERLLSKAPDRIRLIQGIGPALMKAPTLIAVLQSGRMYRIGFLAWERFKNGVIDPTVLEFA
jgi:hypothetical protein